MEEEARNKTEKNCKSNSCFAWLLKWTRNCEPYKQPFFHLKTSSCHL